jgi:uncharacterized membrane protein YeiH
MNPIQILDYGGVVVFAATGALAASRKQLDIIGFVFLATITGIGGGTFRDLILDVPVFWVANPDFVTLSAATAIIVYFGAHLLESRYRMLLWLDAIGLAAFAVMGAEKGLVVTGSAPIAVITGVLTATFGGILRDMVAGEPSVLLRPEIYVNAALVSAVVYVVLDLAGVPAGYSAPLAFIAGLAVRGSALRYGWALPPYRARPGRRPEDIP